MAELVARNVIAVLSGSVPPNQLNIPDPVRGTNAAHPGRGHRLADAAAEGN